MTRWPSPSNESVGLADVMSTGELRQLLLDKRSLEHSGHSTNLESGHHATPAFFLRDAPVSLGGPRLRNPENRRLDVRRHVHRLRKAGCAQEEQ